MNRHNIKITKVEKYFYFTLFFTLPLFSHMFVGKESIVELEIKNYLLRFRVTIPGVFLPPSGVALWVSMRRDRCFVFPKKINNGVEH